MSKKNCFVVMGFGIKTDLATGRKLNLDKSYHALIKPVVENKGINCVRADEILHSGSIDLQMYQQLLSADIVIADLSTSNVNAFYELGIRHALKPKTTIIISEELLSYPFDLNHIVINKYAHLGDSIDYFEVLRFQKYLGETIDKVLASETPDSPVYTFLNGLIPPELKVRANKVVTQIGKALTANTTAAAAGSGSGDASLALFIKQGEEALKAKQFEAAKLFFETALKSLTCQGESALSNNIYLVQRLALATYQSRKPDYVSALEEALTLLRKIDLGRTNDPETVALAGSIEKHLFEENQGDIHLDNAIQLYQRGYYLLHNRHNGINLAYLLHLRSTTPLATSKQEIIADMVWANRIRREVLQLCYKDLKAIEVMETKTNDMGAHAIGEEQKNIIEEQKFWIAVNKAEAHFGLGEMVEYETSAAIAKTVKHEDWMMDSFQRQLHKLEELMHTQKELV